MGYYEEVVADNPAVYYRLDSNAGVSTIPDYSKNSRAGTWQGSGVSFTTSLLTDTSNGAANFTGTFHGHMAAAVNLTNYTLEAIVQTAHSSSLNQIIERDASGGRVFQFRINTAGKVEFITFSSTGNVVTATSTTSVNNNAVHHIVGVYRGTSTEVWVNGVLEGTVAQNAAPASSTAGMLIGAGWESLYSTAATVNRRAIAKIDEVAVYPTALSGERIAAHYGAISAPYVAPSAVSPSVSGFQQPSTSRVPSARWGGFTSSWLSTSLNRTTMPRFNTFGSILGGAVVGATARIRSNGVAGALASALSSTATTMTSDGLADLPAVGAGQHAALTLFAKNSSGRVIKHEIIWVTSHAAGATTATIVRAQEGTLALNWGPNDSWAHAPTARDLPLPDPATALDGQQVYVAGGKLAYGHVTTPGQPLVISSTPPADTNAVWVVIP